MTFDARHDLSENDRKISKYKFKKWPTFQGYFSRIFSRVLRGQFLFTLIPGSEDSWVATHPVN